MRAQRSHRRTKAGRNECISGSAPLDAVFSGLETVQRALLVFGGGWVLSDASVEVKTSVAKSYGSEILQSGKSFRS